MSGELIYTYDKSTEQYSVLNIDIQYIEWLIGDTCRYCGAVVQADKCATCGSSQFVNEANTRAKVEMVGNLAYAQRLLKLAKHSVLYICERTYGNYEVVFDLRDTIMEIEIVKVLKRAIGKMSDLADVIYSPYFFHSPYNTGQVTPGGNDTIVTLIAECEVKMI